MNTFPCATAVSVAAFKGSAEQKSKEYSAETSHLSEVEECVSIISSILLPGSSACEALSPAQKNGLVKVQQVLLGGIKNQRDHVPARLASYLECGKNCQYMKHLLAEYGGLSKKCVRKKKMQFKKIIKKNKIGSKIKKTHSSTINEESHVLKEWMMPAPVISRRTSSSSTIEKVLNLIDLRAPVISRRTSSSSTIEKVLNLIDLRAAAEESYVLEEWTMLAPGIKRKLAEMLSWDSLSKWTFDVFEINKLTNGKALLFMGWAILASPHAQHAMQTSVLPEGMSSLSLDDMDGYDFLENMNIPQSILCNFIRSIEEDYNNENAYHNSMHAADVLQSVHFILTRIEDERIVITELESFSVLLAAIVHDVKHPGRNNNFQVNNQTEYALKYNDRSVLENMHLSSAFSRVMGEHKDDTLNIFQDMKPEEATLCREMCIDTVLHTDSSKHFSIVSEIKCLRMKNSQDSTEQYVTGTDILPFILHSADISNPAKPRKTAIEWTERCLREFFEQGDEEKKLGLPISPLCDRLETKRADSQVGFIKYVIQPTFEVLGMFIPKVNEEINPIIESNLLFWESEMASNIV